MKWLKLLLKTLLIILLIPLGLGGALYWMNEKGGFNLENIEVLIDGTGLEPHYLKPQVEEVEKLIEIQRGQSLWKIDLAQMQGEIRKLPWVEDLVLARQWPKTLQAKIKSYDVKLLLMTRKGEFFPVVGEGEILEPVQMKNTPDATILRGEVFKKNPELRKKAVQVINEIPATGSFSRPQISEIYYKEKEGFFLSLIRSGIEVRIGEDQIALKSGRVSQVLDYLETHQLEARVIDADLSQKVLVRLRKDP